MKRLQLHTTDFIKPFIYCFLISWILICGPNAVFAQNHYPELCKILMLSGQKQGARDLPQDHGISGIWQKMLKLKTTASALHTQAHPDDEHADLLTYLGRGIGARTALLSLNRGESGGNVLGVEFFDQLGLLRTEEFLLAASYYGLDDLYFTSLVDYGFSKRVEEAYEKWGKENTLAEMVRVIRVNRPLVIISRFHGTTRDGHGNHQAAGEVTQLAYQLAGDSSAFPEQINNEGLRPWKALKLYRGGVTAKEHWNIQLNTGVYSPWLGQSYKNFSLQGYSLHRSQVGGQRNEVNGPFMQYYERLQTQVKTLDTENSFFDGIDTSVSGIFRLTGEAPPPGVEQLLDEINTAVDHAFARFQPESPAEIIPFLTTGLSNTRSAIQSCENRPEALFLLQVKERQFTDAINTALGISLRALAMPPGTKEKRSFYDPQPTMGFAVEGQPFRVELVVVNNSPLTIEPKSIRLAAPPNWKIDSSTQELKSLPPGEQLSLSYLVTAPLKSSYSQPYFWRDSLQQNQYELHDKPYRNLPWSAPALEASASYLVNGELVQIESDVQVKKANLPYGYDLYTLKTAPAIAVNILPASRIIPVNKKMKSINVEVELENNFDGAIKGGIFLKTPPGWKVQPVQLPFSFRKPGEKSNFSFRVSFNAIEQKIYKIEAIASANGTNYTVGYHLIRYRDLDEAILYRPAVTSIKGINVNVAAGIRIGYIMGVGDEVPAGLQQLGAKVELLNSTDISLDRLDQYEVIMIGTRAFAVRPDLHTYNQRLLNFAKGGGHLIVLFQTPEFIPAIMAPFPAQLPGNSEEISEENSPIKILNPRHRVLNYPNKITSKDFDNWVEQRGTKFWSQWDTAYVPIISTYDVGQSPQSGGWLMAKYGKGYYTYCAYSFHRQLPSGVEGAFRVMANLISYGKISKK